MKATRHLLLIALALATIAGARADEILWLTTPNPLEAITDLSGTPLDASANDPLTGDFLQLIVSPSGTIAPALPFATSPTGVSGDNLVLQTSFFGFGTGGLDSPIDGLKQIAQSATEADQVSVLGRPLQSGDVLFVRAWTEPSSDYSSGAVPTATDLFYGNSPLFAFVPSQPGVPSDPYVFNTYSESGPITGWVADLRVIPEPSTAMLVLLGLVGLRVSAHRRRVA